MLRSLNAAGGSFNGFSSCAETVVIPIATDISEVFSVVISEVRRVVPIATAAGLTSVLTSAVAAVAATGASGPRHHAGSVMNVAASAATASASSTAASTTGAVLDTGDVLGATASVAAATAAVA
jgi:hypothetical protein